MKVQQVNQQQNTPQFKGISQIATGLGNAAVTGLRFLDTNQAIGACAVDVGCMVAPRTITDFGRGTEAGFETLRREASGTINHASIGPIYGTLAGMLVAAAMNMSPKYGINARKIFADSDAIELLSKMQYESISKSDSMGEYVKKVAAGIATHDGRNLSEYAQKQFADVLKSEIQTPAKENAKRLRNIILTDLGEETNLILKNGDKSIKESAEVIIKNITSLSPALFKEKVLKSFKEAVNFSDVKFVNEIKRFGLGRSILGAAIGAGIGCCIQPLNIYLTKKKTGSDGFVGVEGREKDKSSGFKALKFAAALAFVAFAMATIGKPKDLLKNIQYKSLIPTLNQFKLVYGLTIASRFLAARDKDELREAAIKDTIGFSSWLVLGNFVSKGVLKALDKGLAGKTRDEVLYTALKKVGISTMEDGKVLGFNKLLNKLPEADKLTRGKLRAFTWAQLAGYAFSAVVLGVGIPKLNIYMTKKSEQKRAQARMMNSPMSLMLKPENLAFLSNQTSFTSMHKK